MVEPLILQLLLFGLGYICDRCNNYRIHKDCLSLASIKAVCVSYSQHHEQIAVRPTPSADINDSGDEWDSTGSEAFDTCSTSKNSADDDTASDFTASQSMFEDGDDLGEESVVHFCAKLGLCDKNGSLVDRDDDAAAKVKEGEENSPASLSLTASSSSPAMSSACANDSLTASTVSLSGASPLPLKKKEKGEMDLGEHKTKGIRERDMIPWLKVQTLNPNRKNENYYA